MFIVDCSLLFVVCCLLLFVACCLSFIVVRCLLCIVVRCTCCSLFLVVRGLLSVVDCRLSVVFLFVCCLSLSLFIVVVRSSLFAVYSL